MSDKCGVATSTKERLKSLLSEARPVDNRDFEQPHAFGGNVSISGRDGIVVGNNNSVTIVRTEAATPQAIVPVRPGIDHITDEQAGRIQELVGIIAGRGRRSFGSVYGELFRHLGGGHKLVPSYRLIPLEMYPKAERFLIEMSEQMKR